MSKKGFTAKHWFNSEQSIIDSDVQNRQENTLSSYEKSMPTFENQDSNENEQNMGRFFVPGWKGESLINKDVNKFVEIVDRFHNDVKTKFKHSDQFSRRLKLAVYDEFLSFAEYKLMHFSNLDSYTAFWNELSNENSKHKEQIDEFINILSFRIAVIYLLKVRFIVQLLDQTDSKFDIKNILYPNAFLTSMFKTASSFEIKSKAFEQNVFSWYRPSESIKSVLNVYKNICLNLQITDIIKNVSCRSEEILKQNVSYSHTISHKNFGLYLNSLLINFPLWKNTLKEKSHLFNNSSHCMEAISCLFAGDYLESLSLSHWLAQENNKNIKWEQILCPDFISEDFETGLYTKIFNELQFLTFLSQIAKTQGYEPKRFISDTMNSHQRNRSKSNEIQKVLFSQESNLHKPTYDRVIYNLINYPKNNPQHHLYNKISSLKDSLKEDGLLYIITSKKLFVSSQKSKIENLLENYHIEGIFHLDEIKGKGEIGSFIYVLRNKPEYLKSKKSKYACLNFRFSGNLDSFQNFSSLTKMTSHFFTTHYGDMPPMYHVSENNFKMEFYQDAIVNGQLISSTSKDSNKITHPHFFKKLMMKCHSLDYFFDIQSIDFTQKSEMGNDNPLFNFSNSFKREESDFTIIVDQRIRTKTKVEIIPTSIVEAVAYEYGHSLCSYFYAYPKWPSVDMNIIKAFLETTIGEQIVSLTFTNEMKKVKSNLQKLLIPKDVLNNNKIPEHIIPALKTLTLSSENILSLHPKELENSFKQIENFIPTLSEKYPVHLLKLMSSFSINIENAIKRVGISKKQKINFNNPLIKSPLVLSKTAPIYPDNKEVYIEFNHQALNMIHRPLTKIKLDTQIQGNHVSHLIHLFNDEDIILTIFSDEVIIQFLDFILKNVEGMPISKVLQAIRVPEINDLKAILESYKLLTKTLSEVSTKLPKINDQLINSIISN